MKKHEHFMKCIPESHPHYASLNASWKEGVAASFSTAFTDYYLTPLALLLGATAQQIGFLVAFPNLLASLAQLGAAWLVSVVGSRLRILVGGVSIQAWSLLPLAFLAIIPLPHRVGAFILFVIFFRILGNLIATVWGGLASDYLIPEERGKYFGWRTQVTGAAGLAGLVLGGVLLYALNPISPHLGFFILFLAAAFTRFWSVAYMKKMRDIPLEHKKEDDFTFLQFLGKFRQSNFVRFVFFVGTMWFAITMATPYLPVYLLRDLKYNYFTFMLVPLASILAALAGLRIWGRHMDIVGNAKVLKLTGFFLPLIPLLWILSPHPAWLIAVEAFGGFVLGGFSLASVNFIFDSIAPERRVRALGYASLMSGVAIFLGSLAGGLLADRLPALFGQKLAALFLLSFLLRYSFYFIFSWRFREIRPTARNVRNIDLVLSVVGIRPII